MSVLPMHLTGNLLVSGPEGNKEQIVSVVAGTADGVIGDVQDDPDAARALAVSLATAGYAMFALLQDGPLEAIRPMSEVSARLLAAIAPAPQPEPEPAPQPEPQPEALYVADDEIDLSEEPEPTEPDPAINRVAPLTGHSTRIGPQGASHVATDGQDVPARTTLAMLQEISFLDE